MAYGFQPPRGLFGQGLVATPEDLERQRQMEQQFPQTPAPTPDYPAPQTMQQPAPSGFWNGGDKFTLKDGFAGALAAVGDAFAQQGGGQGGAVSMLTGGRAAQLQKADKFKQAQQIIADLTAQGLSPEQARLVAGRTGSIGDFRQKAPEEDVFIRRMRAAGIDPASQQGRDILRQKIATEASPAPQLMGDGLGGGRWVNPPPPQLFGSGAPVAAAPAAPAASPYGDDWEVVDGPAAGQPAPPPQMSASAQPASGTPMLSQDQWRAAVEALGADAAENWRRRNNIQIGGR